MEIITPMEDEKIIRLFWERSEQALRETQMKYGGMCRHIAGNILRDAQDVEECINDAYLHLWNAVPPEKPKNLAAFLGTIVRNISLTRYRYNHRNKRGGDQIPLLLSELEECLSDGRQPDQFIDEAYFAQVLNVFLGTLSPVNRIIFVRRYWFTDSLDTIAALCGKRESQVKASLFRSRQKLKKALQEGGIPL